MISKSTSLAVLALSVIFVIGCIPSVQPYYNANDVVFDPALLGKWVTEKSKETWTFSRGRGKSYRMEQTDNDGNTGKFVVHLFKIDDAMFIDLFPEKTKNETTDFHQAHHIATHTFFAVDRLDDRFRIRAMNLKWLDELLKETPDAIAHDRINNMVVLRATTGELQKFIAKHLETQGAYSDPAEMKRIETAERGD